MAKRCILVHTNNARICILQSCSQRDHSTKLSSQQHDRGSQAFLSAKCQGFVSMFLVLTEVKQRRMNHSGVSSPFCSQMIVSSDHWALNASHLYRRIQKIDFFEANLLFPFFAAETLMDTRVATAELGWTAYPNSGVSCCC